MLMKQSVLRIAAASAAAVFVTIGAVGPAYADDHGDEQDRGKAAASRSAKSDEAKSHHAKSRDDQSEDSSGEMQEPRRGSKSGGDSAEQDERGAAGQGKANPPRHTPVTVCHRLGNGSYHVLTFDDSALKAHEAHGDIYPVPADGCPATSTAPETATSDEHGQGHTPVTVCHILGNGTYHELTFDDSALKAHEAHGDLYPVPASGCATAAAPTTVPPLALPQSAEVAMSGAVPGAAVLGVEKLLTTQKTTARQGSPAVLGVQQTRSANRAPAQVAPTAGVLPQTGAGRFSLLVVAGLGLLGAGGVMITRKRAQASI
jgi:LPXTG-motif cell wall-anchored protein